MDIEYLLALQGLRESLGSGVESFMNTVSSIGAGVVLMALCLVIYWCADKYTGFTAMLSFCLGNFVNQFVKNIACVYRPWILDQRVVPSQGALSGATGYSFPSGHTVAIATSLGTLAWLGRRKHKILAALCVVIILVVAFSRNYLGVHTPQDVLVALLESVVVVAISCKVSEWLRDHREHDLAILIGSLVMGVVVFVIINVKPFPMDYVDGVLLVDPADMVKDCYEGVGLFCGFVIGWFCERRWVNFDTRALTWPKRIARLAIGIVYVAIIMVGLDPVLKATVGLAWAKLISRGLLLFGCLFLVPLVFKRVDSALERRAH